jgi:TatD DNase family protein
MHDMHCHLDLYDDPLSVATSADRSSIFTVAVTNLPSAYYAARPHMRVFRHLKLALGLHPLLAEHHTPQEKRLFHKAFSETDYVGEIGLDFSRKGIGTRETQIRSVRFVLQLLRDQHKVVSIHSRRAESAIMEMLTEFDVGPVVFHWYSGSLTILDQIIERGDYFSINTAMLNSKSGQRIVDCIPRERLLTETDGPFVIVDKRPSVPADVCLVQENLAARWRESVGEVRVRLGQNLLDYMESAVSGHSV